MRDAGLDNADALAGIVAVEFGEELRLIRMFAIFSGGRDYPPMLELLVAHDSKSQR